MGSVPRSTRDEACVVQRLIVWRRWPIDFLQWFQLSLRLAFSRHSRHRASTNEEVQIRVSFYPALAEVPYQGTSTRLDRKASFGPFPRFCMHSLEDQSQTASQDDLAVVGMPLILTRPRN
jgi:hypothetical protein